jgi:UPF0755 protein
MSKKLLSLGIILLLIIGLMFAGYNSYAYYFVSPEESPKGNYELVVNSGDDIEIVAKKLSQAKVIPSDSSLLLQARLNSLNGLQSGKYILNLPDSPEGVLLQIRTESTKIRDELAKLNNKPVIKITFKEGETLDQMIAKLVENGVSQKTELESIAKDNTKFSTQKYPFLPKPLTCSYEDIKICAKYFLEGYLYPDTYNFTQPMDPVVVYETFLNNFKTKVWSKLGSEVGDKDFYKVITLASVLEKETGRTKGVTDATKEELSEERKIMAGVFYNRLQQKMPWQSDVTAEYGTGKKLCQQTFVLEGCMLLDSPLAKTKYNTYQNSGYPIGPITSPQFDNINAALNPDSNDYLFFVSDITGKKYFAKTSAEHFNVIREVSKINKGLA